MHDVTMKFNIVVELH